MSYTVKFEGEVPFEMAQEGSTIVTPINYTSSLDYPDWDLTYNYSEGLDKAFAGVKPAPSLIGRKDYGGNNLDYGLWLLMDKTPLEQIRLLKQGVDRLDPATATNNYWDGTDGNVRKILEKMLRISEWWLERHPEKAYQIEEGVWYRWAC